MSRFALPALLFVLLAAGCDSDAGIPPSDPTYREPMVNGWVYKTEYYDNTIDYDKDVEVFDNAGLRMVPKVTLNGAPLEIYYYTPTMYRYGDVYYNPVNTKYELEVEHFWGKAFSRVVLPGDFRVTGPPENYILGMESTLVATWQAAPSAQWYWVSLYCEYDFNDTLLQWDSYTFILDTLVYDTFLAIPPGRVFPGQVLSLIEGDATASAWAGNGPAVEPGDLGNVRGAGFGFFNAINEPKETYFYVGAPPRERRSPGPGLARARLLERLRTRTAVPGTDD